MLTSKLIRSALDVYEANTTASIRNARLTSGAPPIIETFNTSKLTEDLIATIAERIPTGGRKEDIGSKYIYTFALTQSDKQKLQSLSDCFNLARETQKSNGGIQSLCKLNKIEHSSQALYVGRSSTPRARFRAHMSKDAAGPYAIRFMAWATSLNLDINFHLVQFKGLNDHSAQVLEDALWDELNPLLGRRGAR